MLAISTVRVAFLASEDKIGDDSRRGGLHRGEIVTSSTHSDKSTRTGGQKRYLGTTTRFSYASHLNRSSC